MSNFFCLDLLPEPSYKNVIPSGEGWYRFSFKKWRRWTNTVCHANYDGRARYISDETLLQFAKEAVEVLNE